MIDSEQHTGNIAGGRPLDPFSFFPGVESKIKGLGGGEVGYDPTYAFHTLYAEAAPGRAHFILNFEGLTARRGTLQLWVHMLPLETGARARVVNSERIQLNRLIQKGNRHAIPFESFQGVSFALHGAIIDESDARAQSLTVILDRPADPNDIRVTSEARTSSYGREKVKPVASLVSASRATLAEPVCQSATEPQISEKCAIAILDSMGLSGGDDLSRWQGAYLARALQCYGMLAPGARGVAFEGATRPFAAALQCLGPEVKIANTGDEGDGVVSFDARQITADLVNFDFLWSAGIGHRVAAPPPMIEFIEAAMHCLRPGGIAIHLLPFDPDGDRLTWPQGRGPFTRNGIEQLALTMISRGHQVAQVKIDIQSAIRLRHQGNSELAGQILSEFGVIVRRAPSAL